MKTINITKIIFIFVFSIFLIPNISHAQTQKTSTMGCCEKVIKTTLKFEVEDMNKEPCEAIKKEQEKLEESQRKYENVTWFENRVAFLGRCRTGQEISEGTLPKFTLPELKVNIPGLIKFTQPDFCANSQGTEVCISWIGQYIAALAGYLTMIVGIVAAITLMVGGVRWLTAAGNAQAVSDAKGWIINSLLGLVLTLCAYTLLVVINPKLVTFSPLRITWIEGLNLLQLKKSGGACANGECTQIDEAVTNNSQGISGAILKSIMVGGEGCNPAVSSDGHSSCGYCQAIPETRIKTCGLKGDLSDCELFKNDIQADINCSAKVLMEMAPRCGNFEDIVRTASCYNAGGTGQNCGTDDYCHRVEKYFNEKCGQSTAPKNP